jgi:hypothetical protein
MAIDGGIAVQDVDYAALRQRLLADKQVLEAPAELSKGDIDPAQLEGVVIDSQFARLSPAWKGNRTDHPRLGPSYFHDLDARDGRATAQFSVKMPQAGRFRVKLLFPPKADRATNVPVVISGGGKTYRATVNQRKPADWIGVYDLPAEFTVTISNRGVNGVVTVDGLQVVPARASSQEGFRAAAASSPSGINAALDDHWKAIVRPIDRINDRYFSRPGSRN